MKLNMNKISALLGVGLIGALTFVPTLNTQALLTAPTSYNYRYSQTSTDSVYRLRTSTSTIKTPTYTATYSGIESYYAYSTEFEIITGFNVFQYFNYSNSSWADTSTGYVPTSPIGSDNSVGMISNKVNFVFSNNTSSDYILSFDRSSSGNTPFYFINYNYFVAGGIYDAVMMAGNENLNRIIIPSYYRVELYVQDISSAQYLDAWYLINLGLSNAFDAGFDDGYDAGLLDTDGYALGYQDGLRNNPNILLNGFQAMVGILVNFVLMIVNLEVFGVSILGIFSIVVLFTGIVWVLKLIRG
jgi:hypothetical protein